jgi:hypothetical protein
VAGKVAVVSPVRVLDAAKKSGVLVDLPLDYLGALIKHHPDPAVASELDDQQTEIASHVLWSGITQKTTSRSTPT